MQINCGFLLKWNQTIFVAQNKNSTGVFYQQMQHQNRINKRASTTIVSVKAQQDTYGDCWCVCSLSISCTWMKMKMEKNEKFSVMYTLKLTTFQFGLSRPLNDFWTVQNLISKLISFTFSYFLHQFGNYGKLFQSFEVFYPGFIYVIITVNCTMYCTLYIRKDKYAWIMIWFSKTVKPFQLYTY